MKSKLVPLSFSLTLVSVFLTLLINKWIADRYLIADGKTRALFGITELLSFGYQYYVAILGILSVILASSGIYHKQNRAILALLLGAGAILLVFVRIWRLYIL